MGCARSLTGGEGGVGVRACVLGGCDRGSGGEGWGGTMFDGAGAQCAKKPKWAPCPNLCVRFEQENGHPSIHGKKKAT